MAQCAQNTSSDRVAIHICAAMPFELRKIRALHNQLLSCTVFVFINYFKIFCINLYVHLYIN